MSQEARDYLDLAVSQICVEPSDSVCLSGMRSSTGIRAALAAATNKLPRNQVQGSPFG